VRVPVTELLESSPAQYVSNKFEVSTAFRFRANLRDGTDGQTDGMQHSRPDTSVRWPLDGAETMHVRCSLLVLRAMRRQRGARDVILVIFELHKK